MSSSALGLLGPRRLGQRSTSLPPCPLSPFQLLFIHRIQLHATSSRRPSETWLSCPCREAPSPYVLITSEHTVYTAPLLPLSLPGQCGCVWGGYNGRRWLCLPLHWTPTSGHWPWPIAGTWGLGVRRADEDEEGDVDSKCVYHLPIARSALST